MNLPGNFEKESAFKKFLNQLGYIYKYAICGKGEKVMEKLNKYIDHTLLEPNATQEQIDKVIAEAKKYQFASVCVNPFWVKYVSEKLQGTKINTVTVIGFPLGATTTETKVFEATQAVANGADECDMVQNIGAFLSEDYDVVLKDEKSVVEAVHSKGKKVKVILENCFLNSQQIKKACLIAEKSGADFVKTSTGFAKYGARAEDVKIMAATVGTKMGIKAAGGIHTKADACQMIASGATRLGASASLKIIKES